MADTKKVLMWVALGCGGLLILVLATCVGVGYYAKKRLTAEIAKENPALAETISKGGIAEGLKAGAGHMVALGASMYGTMVVTTLPKEEQKPHMATLERLAKVGGQLSPEEVDTISKAMDKAQKTHEADKSLPTPEEVRAFMATIMPIAEKYEPK